MGLDFCDNVEKLKFPIERAIKVNGYRWFFFLITIIFFSIIDF